eukprot:6551823-Alexandrium_andersonii.AAC.1
MSASLVGSEMCIRDRMPHRFSRFLPPPYSEVHAGGAPHAPIALVHRRGGEHEPIYRIEV